MPASYMLSFSGFIRHATSCCLLFASPPCKLPYHHRSRIRNMTTATLSSKFQLSLPKALRESMHLQAGQQFELIPMGSVIQLVPKTSIKQLRGIARGANPAQYRDQTDRS